MELVNKAITGCEIVMDSSRQEQSLGLELVLEHLGSTKAERILRLTGDQADVLYPEMDADDDHVHFEMVPMGGNSLLWLTVRRDTPPQLAAASLRKIADLLDRHGHKVLTVTEGASGSFGANGGVVDGPLSLSYDENGDLVIPQNPISRPTNHPAASDRMS